MCVCVHKWLSVSVYLFLHLYAWNLGLCVHLLYMCPTPPSFNPATVLWRLADVQRGRGRVFWLESVSLTPETSASFFCQKAKNIRKRTFLCIADGCRGGGVCPGTPGDGKRKGEGRLFPLTVCRDTRLHVSECLCVSSFFFLSSQVAVYNLCHFSGNLAGAQLFGGFVAQMVTCAVWLSGFVHHYLSVLADGSSLVDLCGCGSVHLQCEWINGFVHFLLNILFWTLPSLVFPLLPLRQQKWPVTVSLSTQRTEYRITHVLPEEDVFYPLQWWQ